MAIGGRKACWRKPRRIPSEIDLIVLAELTRTVFPATCLVQERIGAKKAWALTCPPRAPFCLRVDGGRAVRRHGYSQESSGHRQRYQLPFSTTRIAQHVCFRRWRRRSAAGAAGPNEGIIDFSTTWMALGKNFYICRAAGRSIRPAGNCRKRMHYVHQEGRKFSSMRARMAEMATLYSQRMVYKGDWKCWFPTSEPAHYRARRSG